MSFNVTIEVIDHKDQAYETTGDWGFIREPAEEGKLGSKKPLSLWIKVSRTGDWRYEMLVALHEFVEAILCEHDGVYEDRVNAFDIEFEKERLPGTDDEPGDDKAAPYFYQHQIASMVERLVALMIGVDWNDYCDANAKLNPKSSLNE